MSSRVCMTARPLFAGLALTLLCAPTLANTLNGYVQEVCPVSNPLKRESAEIAKGRRTDAS